MSGARGSWVASAALGIAAVLLTTIWIPGPLLVVVVALLLAPRGARLAALSGVLTGFGALWCALLAAQASRGGEIGNAPFWWAVGLIPLVLGLALLVMLALASARRPGAGGPAEG